MTAAHNPVLSQLHNVASVLIATPNTSLRNRLGDNLRKVTKVEEVCTGAEALSKLDRHGARILILDRKLPDLDCDELIGVVERQYPGTDVVLLDGDHGLIHVPEDLSDNIAYQWFQDFNVTVERPAPLPPTPVATSASMLLPGMVGSSEPMQRLAALVRAVAPHSTSVLITGETGAGKELVAESVHKLSPRSDKPFITINCAAIPETLIEAELFGYTRGAFTGAVQSRLGRIHAAQSGSIFFDEIGELPLASQSKLLRFLESGEVQRLGSGDVFQMDVRVIAATNVDLESRVERGLFREDLFYRLSIFPIELPPLRVRRSDIPLLARHFIEKLTGQQGARLAPETEAKLTSHLWPGNVRELRNVIERAFVLSNGGTAIAPEQILLRKPCASVRAASESS
jgi:DNA-binding NtrC family response regulator